MLKIQLNNSNHRRIEFTEKSSQSRYITTPTYRSGSGSLYIIEISKNIRFNNIFTG